jgi:glutathione S-transferase
VGLADAALFPTLTFCRFMLEPIFGWKPIFDSRPALGRYWAAMEADADAARVRVWHPSACNPLTCTFGMGERVSE